MNAIRQRMEQTGIGLAGVEGVWWLPAIQPFALPRQLADELSRIASAVFALFDVASELYGTPEGVACGLDHLLTHKLPSDIPRFTAQEPVLAVRPDFQLQVINTSPGYRLLATELEICPSAQGFAHAMQVGYGLEPDLVESFARVLAGRELLIVGSIQWSEFLFEQLAFCRALAEVGARGRVLYDEPIAALAARVQRGDAWNPPMFGIPKRPAIWHDDITARISAHGFERFVWPHTADWPKDVGDAVVFRFGYFDCFRPDRLGRLLDWGKRGATFLNPTTFMFDSKVVLAALQLPAVRNQISTRAPESLAVLDTCIPETILVSSETVERLRNERAAWVIKYAGYDRGNQAWGGRSLQVGMLHTQGSWERMLERTLELPWPVVAQRAVPTAHIDITYLDAHNEQCLMHNGATRLRSFMLRDAHQGSDDVIVCGSHLTVCGGSFHVAESTDAVQAPVVFEVAINHRPLVTDHRSPSPPTRPTLAIEEATDTNQYQDARPERASG